MSGQTMRAVVMAMALCGVAGAHLRADDVADPRGERTGGATTVFANGRNAFSFPFANLSDAERTRFAIGNSFFRRNWVEAPSSTQARDGLGPLFIARSCGGCHDQDGRGAPPAGSDARTEPAVALLLRLSVPGAGPHGGPRPDPVYGDQVANAAVQGVMPEARIVIEHVAMPGRFADGTRYLLQQPHYRLEDLAYGPVAPSLLMSPRIAPQLAGIGLLAAIADAEIERNAREQAAAGGPVRGMVNRVWDAPSASMRIGRFGWKANVVSLAQQMAAAFRRDMLMGDGFTPWKEFDHPDYGKVEIGGSPKTFGRVPPAFLIQEELHRNMAFTLYHAECMPLVRIAEATVEDAGRGLRRLVVTVENRGVLPTRSAHDVQNGINPPTVVSVRGAEVVAAGIRTDPYREQVTWQEVRPERVLVPTIPGLERVVVEFLLQGTGNAIIEVTSTKAGSDQKSVRVG